MHDISLRPDDQLSTTNPNGHAEFVQGGSSVQLGSNNPFGRIPVDQRNGEQGQSDTRGNRGVQFETRAVSRYYLTAKYRAVYLRTLRDMMGHGSSKLSHHDLQGPKIRKDEANIKSVIDLMETTG